MITELKTSLPVTVTSKNNRKGYALYILEMGQEHHVFWGVALDDDGTVWWIPNTEIRVQPNWSFGRMR